MKQRYLFLGLLLLFSSVTFGQLSGTKTVGPGGDYVTLTAAFADITAQGLSANIILKLVTGYTSTTETFPLVPPTIGTAHENIIIMPGVSGLSITSSSADGTIAMDACKFVVFDGRVNGSGTTRDLVIENTNTAAFTIDFVNDASNNEFEYCIVKGVNTGTWGTITFDWGLVTGNDDNTIDNCDIRDGATMPVYPILGNGYSAAVANNNITISNCNIFNFYSATTSTICIYINAGCSAWNIVNNSIYEQTTMTPSVAGVGWFAMIIAVGDGYNISGNYIGGTSALCGGTPLTYGTTTISDFIYCIRIYNTVSTSNAINISNNTISNIKLNTTGTGTAGSFIFLGYLLSGGNVNLTGNTIGSATGTGNLQFNIGAGTLTGCHVMGCYSVAPMGSIQNNNFGSVTLTSAFTGTTGYNTIYGFYVASNPLSANLDISGNVIGSITTPNSLQTAGTNFYNQFVGIYSIPGSGTGTVNIHDNTCANWTTTSTNTASYMLGIRNAGTIAVTTIENNTIRDLTSASGNTTGTNLAAIVGISCSNSKPGQIVRKNNIYNLSSTAATASVVYNGIYVSGSGGTMMCEKNFIHNLSMSSTSSSAGIYGMFINATSNTGVYRNNMIQLGVKSDGTALGGGYVLNGIYEAGGSNSLYFNSIYVGGTASGVTGNTYAFNSLVTINNRVYQNNIFYNARTGGTTGKHYAVKVGGTTVNPTGLTMNFNVYYAPSGVFGYFNSADVANLNAWRSAVGMDGNSMSANPQYLWPNGNSSNANLHISPADPTPVEGQGMAIASIADDYDSELRSGLTPTDIGADAGNFIQLDLSGPTITYSLLSNITATTNRVLPGFATITDPSGVNFASGTSPRLYYKKSTDANAYLGNTSADNGWKWVETGSGSSPASFTINYALLYNSLGGAGVVASGDQIQYFVVAQDLLPTPNVSINQGAFSVYPSTVALTASAFPVGGFINSYFICTAIPAIVNVGVGQPYTTLTADDAQGFFRAVNRSVLNSNVTVNITSDLTEPGTIALLQWAEEGTGTYTMSIVPDASTLRTISGTAVAAGSAMIPIAGADRLIIDGGTGKNLLFRNTNATAANTGPTIQWYNGSLNCTLTQTIVENNGTTGYGELLVSAGVNNVTISGNDIRDATGGTTGRTLYAIAGNSLTTTINIVNNNISNFTGYGILLSVVADGCNVTGNSIYYNNATIPTATQTCVGVFSGGGHTVSNNYLGGQAPICGGSPWVNSGAVSWYGLNLGMSPTSPASSIQGNVIKNLSLTSTGAAAFDGIYASSGIVNIGTVTGNVIGDVSTPNSITSTGTSGLWAIYANTSATIANNIIANMTATSATPSNVYGIRIQADFPIVVEKNQIYNIGATNPSAVSTGPTAGVMVYGSLAGMSNTYRLSNNVISLGHGISNDIMFVGFWDYNTGTKADYYYNSVSIGGATTTGTNGGAFALYKMSTSVNTIKDNSFSCSRTGWGNYTIVAIYDGFVSDYNDLYNIYPDSVGVYGNFVYNLRDWQTVTGGDTHSISADPLYTSSGNLLPTTGSPLIGVATPLPGIVETDILNNPRNALNPTMGAYELAPPVTTKSLVVKVFLEGFYDVPTGVMNKTQDVNPDDFTQFDKWPLNHVDTISVLLVEDLITWPDPIPYNYEAHGKFIDMDGTITITDIPGALSGNYFIVIKHRQSVETWSAAPVSFAGSAITYDFTIAASQAFGNNQKDVDEGGIFGLWGGDVTSMFGPQDGYIDIFDNNDVFNLAQLAAFGYIPEDLTGFAPAGGTGPDGFVDIFDMALVFNNMQQAIGMNTPPFPMKKSPNKHTGTIR